MKNREISRWMKIYHLHQPLRAIKPATYCSMWNSLSSVSSSIHSASETVHKSFEISVEIVLLLLYDVLRVLMESILPVVLEMASSTSLI